MVITIPQQHLKKRCSKHSKEVWRDPAEKEEETPKYKWSWTALCVGGLPVVKGFTLDLG